MKKIQREHLEKISHRYQVLFAIFCAEQVIHLVTPEHLEVCRAAIDAAKGFVSGEVTAEECKTAANAARVATAAVSAAADAAWAAASTTYACWAADYAADYTAAINKEKIVEQQWNYYYELLNLDSNLEKALVGG